jgi:type IV secretory pathway TraG/TraD family ATPase VirD4
MSMDKLPLLFETAASTPPFAVATPTQEQPKFWERPIKQISEIDQNVWLLMFLAILWGCYTFLNKSKGGVIGRARMATKREIRQSTKAAIKAINEPREMTGILGYPKRFSISPSGKIALSLAPTNVLLRKLQEHVMCWGGAGAGKSRFFLNPLARYLLMLGLPGIVVDLKGDEERAEGKIAPSSEIAGFALTRGYEIFSIAPFFNDSDCLNIVQLLEDANDTATANTLGNALVENGLAPGEKPNNWDQSGGQFIAAGMMMAREQPEGRGDDLATVQKMLARLAGDPKAIENATIGQYQKAAYDEFLSAANSPETAASIAFSALRMMSKIMTPQITAVFCRKTTIPIVLKKKQLLIFRVDPQHATVTLPLVAAAIELILKRNVYSGSLFGGFALLDELPQYRLPTLPQIAAVARSKKWALIYGAQGENILEQAYGEAGTKALMENCQTVAVMRLASTETAKKYSEILGKEDVKTKSKTHGKDTSTTDREDQRDLVPSHELMQQPDGRCILWSPTVQAEMKVSDCDSAEKMVRIPRRVQLVVTPEEEKVCQHSIKVWKRYKPSAKKRSKARPLTEKELYGRELLVKELLPSSTPESGAQSPKIEEQLRVLFSTDSF